MWHDTIFPKLPNFIKHPNLPTPHSCAPLKISKQLVKKWLKSVDKLYNNLMIKVDNFSPRKVVKIATY